MPPLPPELAGALAQLPAGAGKRERTRLQLLLAAMDVFGSRGVGASTMQEIAAAAGVANGTVYNHFQGKDEVLHALALLLAETLCRRISASYDHITEGAERMAIGNRRYMWLAAQAPAWAMLVLEIAAAAPQLLEEVQKYAHADLKLGMRQKVFKPVSEAAAMDLINGTVSRAMLVIAGGHAPANHDVAVAATVLRGLGMEHAAALAVAKRPLPAFPADTP